MAMKLPKVSFISMILLLCLILFKESQATQNFDENVMHQRHSLLRDSLRMNEAKNPDKSNFLTFTSSCTSILVSEIGDKTFFIAAMMAMKYGKSWVFVGSYGAMVVMTVISTAFGWVLLKLISPTITMAGACLLFFAFGIKLLRDAFVQGEGVIHLILYDRRASQEFE